jgi:hypothetical protein
MKRFLLGVLAVVFAVTLGGCFGDPVKSDIEDYIDVDQKVTEKYSKQFMNDFQRKANAARTPDEFTQIVGELKEVMLDVQKEYGALKPKSDEMKELVGNVNESFALMIESLDDLDIAVRSEDQKLMVETVNKMSKAANDVNSAESAIIKLANEKGMNVRSR